MATPPPGAAPVSVKLFVSQALSAVPPPEKGSFTVLGVPVGRVWLQGVVVAVSSATGEALLDDGSGTPQMGPGAAAAHALAGVISLRLAAAPAQLLGAEPGGGVGALVMAVGALKRAGSRRFVKVQRLSVLPGAHAEAQWTLEVVELWRDIFRLLGRPAAGAAPPQT